MAAGDVMSVARIGCAHARCVRAARTAPRPPRAGARARRAATRAAAAAAEESARRIFVGDLSWKLSLPEMEDAVRSECERYGAVASVELPRDRGSKKMQHRGFGFVTFEASDCAAAAVAGLPGTEVDGRPMRANYASKPPAAAAAASGSNAGARGSGPVRRAGGRRHVKLYFGNLKFSATSEDLEELAGAYGAVVDAKVVCDAEGYSRGFGFVTFAKAASSDTAIRELDGVFVPGLSHGGLSVNEYGRLEAEEPPANEEQAVLREIYSNLQADEA